VPGWKYRFDPWPGFYISSNESLDETSDKKVANGLAATSSTVMAADKFGFAEVADLLEIFSAVLLRKTDTPRMHVVVSTSHYVSPHGRLVDGFLLPFLKFFHQESEFYEVD
jgi:hypothetical protein